MTADPTGFDRLVTGDHCCACSRVCGHIGGPWFCASHQPARFAAPIPSPLESAADVAVLMVEAEGLRRENALLRAERDDARRQAAELDARLTRMTHDSAARDRVAPMTAWKDDE